jgi:hypothetical protein
LLFSRMNCSWHTHFTFPSFNQSLGVFFFLFFGRSVLYLVWSSKGIYEIISFTKEKHLVIFFKFFIIIICIPLTLSHLLGIRWRLLYARSHL